MIRRCTQTHNSSIKRLTNHAQLLSGALTPQLTKQQRQAAVHCSCAASSLGNSLSWEPCKICSIILTLCKTTYLPICCEKGLWRHSNSNWHFVMITIGGEASSGAACYSCWPLSLFLIIFNCKKMQLHAKCNFGYLQCIYFRYICNKAYISIKMIKQCRYFLKIKPKKSTFHCTS